MINRAYTSRFLTGLLLVTAISCSSVAIAQSEMTEAKKKEYLKYIPKVTPLDIPPGVKTKPVKVEGLVVRTLANYPVGEIQQFLPCQKVGLFFPNSENPYMAPPAVLRDLLESNLKNHGINIIGDGDQIFADPNADKEELLIGGVIKDMKVRVCEGPALFGKPKGDGEAEIEVNWQVFNPRDRSIVYQNTTRGSSKVPMKVDGNYEVLPLAIVSATLTLLADQKFIDLVTIGASATSSSASVDSSAVTLNKTLISRIPASTKRFQDHATDIRANVATIINAGSTGSGFFVSDRHIITNAHVVGGASFVKVKLITGREILGDVVTKNTARDVALVQTEPGGFPGLPIRTDELEIGSNVLAIGSPLGEKNEGTVSAGIVSSYRTEDNQRYIQSDVNVMPGNSGGPLVDDKGNVIGLTVLGRLDPRTGGGSGLNFFIPITDAMDKLGLQFR